MHTSTEWAVVALRKWLGVKVRMERVGRVVRG